MSDSASDSRPSDVLSSIRRLVTAAPARTSAHRISDPGPERLLLTPALRVPDPEGPSRAASRPVRSAPPGRLSLEDRIAELEAAVSGQPQDWEPDGSEVQDVHRPTEVLLPPIWEDREEAVPEAPEAAAAALSRADADPSTEDAGTDAPASAQVTAFPPQPQMQVAEPAQADMPAGLFFTRHDRPSETATPDPVDAGLPPPPDGEVEADTVEAMPTFRHSERDVAAVQAQVEDALIDSDALREMVAGIVRDELQGPLGEKITRNIRKLVRREIERAMTVRHFD